MYRKNVLLVIYVMILVLFLGIAGFFVIKKKFLPLPLAYQPVSTYKDAGLLIGLYSPKTDNYRTLWIYPQGNNVKFIELPNLIVPRGKNFLQVGRASRVEVDGEVIPPGSDEPIPAKNLIEVIWTMPVSKQSDLRPIPTSKPDEKKSFDYCTSKSVSVHFVGSELISYSVSEDYECGVHPDAQISFAVSRLESIESSSLSIVDVLGSAGGLAFNSGLKSEKSSYSKDRSDNKYGPNGADCANEATTTQTNWAIIRKEGRWIAQGWADTHRLCGYGFEFDIPIKLPRSIVGYNEMYLPWEKIKRQVPDVFDAFNSPTKNILVLLTPKELKVFSTQDSTIGNQIASTPLYSFTIASSTPTEEEYGREKVVMAQWAIGEEVSLWNTKINKLVGR